VARIWVSMLKSPLYSEFYGTWNLFLWKVSCSKFKYTRALSLFCVANVLGHWLWRIFLEGRKHSSTMARSHVVNVLGHWLWEFLFFKDKGTCQQWSAHRWWQPGTERLRERDRERERQRDRERERERDHMHAYTHARTHARTRARTHARTHARVHTHHILNNQLEGHRLQGRTHMGLGFRV